MSSTGRKFERVRGYDGPWWAYWTQQSSVIREGSVTHSQHPRQGDLVASLPDADGIIELKPLR